MTLALTIFRLRIALIDIILGYCDHWNPEEKWRDRSGVSADPGAVYPYGSFGRIPVYLVGLGHLIRIDPSLSN